MEEGELQKENKRVQDDIAAKTQSYNVINEGIEKVQAERKDLDDNLKLLNEEHNRLEKTNSMLERDKSDKETTISQLTDQIKSKIEQKETIENDIKTVTNEIAVLNNKKGELQKEICKEYYTLWNFEFLSNNKKSVFTSFLTTVLISAALPFLFGIFKSSSESSEISSSKIKSLQENSQPRLEQLSDDEDSGEMVASSSALPNRDLKYNYDRDAMERNEDPKRCFDHIRKKYGVKENLKLHWENLKDGEGIQLNFWKVENGELTFTKIMLRKILKAEKPLLTFELFQTQLNDGTLYSDCEETELVEDDGRNEAKLAMKIFHGLPQFCL